MCLTTLLLQPLAAWSPKTILLDEPELGLHPYALQLLGGMLKSASATTQIIASTQSVTFANQFDWEDIIVVEQPDNASDFRKLNKNEVKDWLDNYNINTIKLRKLCS